MRAVLWTDYICPWCYLARDRTALMVELGVDVETRPFELHPDLPPEGRRIRPGGRLAGLLDHIESECAQVGLPFRRPGRVPNSRRALETAEVVRRLAPEAYPAVDEALFRLHWVEGAALDDPVTVAEVLDRADVDPDEVDRAVVGGLGRAEVDRSMDEARANGVTATPTWLFDQGFLLPGAQPRDTVERWVERMVARRAGAAADGSAAAPGAHPRHR